MGRRGPAREAARLTPAGPPAGPPVAIVVKGYPRLSETFVAQEVEALERRGLQLALVSLRRPYDRLSHPVHAEVRTRPAYLPEYLREAPGRVLAGHLRAAVRAPGRYLGTLGRWLADLGRDPTRSRVRRFGQAGVLAAELPAAVRHLHAHFLHTPASVARYAALMSGRSYSLSAHAKDVWTTPAWELRAKLRGARFTVACTAQARAHLQACAPAARVELIYHGLDGRRFPPPARVGSARDGRDPEAPVRLLAVGRFQPKKGFDVLLEAVARVRGQVHLTIVGYGPLEADLRVRARRLGLEARVDWTGPLDQPGVLARYRASDLFVLAPRVAPDGDRDGLPNVVVEALSQGLPVIGTRTAALHEIVEDGREGRLVPPDDPAALAAAIEALAGDPAARARCATAALERVAGGWDLDAGVERLAGLLGAAGDRPAPAGAGPGALTPATFRDA